MSSSPKIAVCGVLVMVVGLVARGQEPRETAWPLRIDSAAGVIEVYQPQPEALTGDKLKARAAVSLSLAGAAGAPGEPVFGAMWMTARVFTDRDARTVTILDVDVKRVRFPDANE